MGRGGQWEEGVSGKRVSDTDFLMEKDGKRWSAAVGLLTPSFIRNFH
jgi:hypothetical protein